MRQCRWACLMKVVRALYEELGLPGHLCFPDSSHRCKPHLKIQGFIVISHAPSATLHTPSLCLDQVLLLAWSALSPPPLRQL